jgi:hypothetical protein
MKEETKTRKGKKKLQNQDLTSPELKARFEKLSKNVSEFLGDWLEEHAQTRSEQRKRKTMAKNITDKDLLLFSLYVCDGAEHPVCTEDVAAQVFRYSLGQERFRWARHDYPDKERVANELGGMGNAKGTTVIVGTQKDGRDGWMLTEAGVDRIREIKPWLTEALDFEGVRQGITSSSLYKIFSIDPNMKEANHHDMASLIRCLSDTPRDERVAAFDRVMRRAKDIDATDLIEFLKLTKIRFKGLF